MKEIDADGPVRDETVDYSYYLSMIKRKQRIGAFEAALSSCIKDGDVVVEIGAGLGTYSFFAARAGAARVYAVERERVIHVARELAARNGLAGRIVFLEGDSTEIVLPESADVLVIEDFSTLFVRRGLEELIRDAVKRHLKEGGIVVPRSVSLYLAPVGDHEIWKSCLDLEDESYKLYGLDLGLLREMMLDSPHVRHVDAGSLLANPQPLKTIDLKQPESFLFDEVLTAQMNRSGTLYGLAGWFDLNLTDSILLSNGPANPESTWHQVFFPFSNPLKVTEGETVTLKVACVRSSRTRDIWWTWQALASSGLADNRSFQGTALPTSVLGGSNGS